MPRSRPMMGDYWLCGWRVHSEIPIPDLMPWLGVNCPADLTIRIGPVPSLLGDLAFNGPLVQVASDGTCRVAVDSIGAYLVDPSGHDITIAPALPPSAPAIRMLLLGTVFGIVCHQRNLLPLHASCVLVDGHAVAFAGVSGIGKSTLAASFFKRGWPVLADDVTPVDLDVSGGPVVRPAIPRLKLWRDVMVGLRLPLERLERSRDELERYHVPTDRGFLRQPQRLAAVYHLRRQGDPAREPIVQLRGLRAASDSFDAIYRPSVGATLGRPNRLLAAVARLSADVPTYILSRRHELADIDELVDHVVARQASTAVTV